jgi:hypothetical protein
MPIDFHAPFFGGPAEAKQVVPQKVSIRINLDRPFIYKTWQAEASSTMKFVERCMLTKQRIPRVLQDKRGETLAYITIE